MWEGKEREDPRVLLKFPSRDWSRYRRPRAIMMLMVMKPGQRMKSLGGVFKR